MEGSLYLVATFPLGQCILFLSSYLFLLLDSVVFLLLVYLPWALNTTMYCVLFCFLNKFIYLFIFIFGCVGSSLLCEGFLQLRRAGATLHRGARASHRRGLSRCRAQAPDAQAQ